MGYSLKKVEIERSEKQDNPTHKSANASDRTNQFVVTCNCTLVIIKYITTALPWGPNFYDSEKPTESKKTKTHLQLKSRLT